MSQGYAPLASAEPLLPLLRLDDLRAAGHEDIRVMAAVLTTHDLNLRFVLAELLPGWLAEPDDVPPGTGPKNRSYRSAMQDLPPVLLMCAPEASVDLRTPWYPPSLEVVQFSGSRLLHAKVSAILYEQGGSTFVRLVAASANLTRRAFTHNLEVFAYDDLPLERAYWSLVELRGFLDALDKGAGVGTSPAFRMIHGQLRARWSRKADTKTREWFLHSADPDEFRSEIAKWLTQAPVQGAHRAEGILVSPFFSSYGPQLQRFWRDDLKFGDHPNLPVQLVVDRRGTQEGKDARKADDPSHVPPPWFGKYRGKKSGDFAPAFIVQSRRDGVPKSTGRLGRSLHAKLVGVGYSRPRTDKRAWRLLVGSVNFSESAFGLQGEGSNLEAGFLVEHRERERGDVLGAVHPKQALCVQGELADHAPPEVSDDLEQERLDTSAIKALFKQWRSDAGCLIEQAPGGFRIWLAGPIFPEVEIRHEDVPFEPTEGGSQVIAGSLAPYFLRVRVRQGGKEFHWPLPVHADAIQHALRKAAGASRQTDRLLDYWLHGGVLVDYGGSDEDEQYGIAGLAGGGGDSMEQGALGSWRLNRLMLGVRRRLVGSLRGRRPRLPPAEALLRSVRVIELVELAESLPQPDALYFAIHLRDMLLGYRSGEIVQQGGRSRTRAKIEGDWVVAKWREDPLWRKLEDVINQGSTEVPSGALDLLSESATELFNSVRNLKDVRRGAQA